MQIAVLGPLEVTTVDGVLDVAGARLRALLIRLAIDAPAPVATSALVDALWAQDPPAEPANALQSLVSRLRRALNKSSGPDLVQQVPGGYRLMIGADDLDLRRFSRLARDGRQSLAAGQYHEAANSLRLALALWRSDTFDAAIERDTALLARLQEQHLDALADRIEADLMLGRAADLIVELDGLVIAHPLRERITLLLLQALGAAGRVPDALAAYERLRRTLADELGIDPSAALQTAHLALLRGEALTEAPTTRAQPGPPADLGLDESRVRASYRRNNLRPALTSFVGREEDVRRIGKLLDEGRLITLVGPGGAGKTRLAGEAVSRLLELAELTATADDGAGGFEVGGFEVGAGAGGGGGGGGGGGPAWLAELAPVTDPADVPQVVLTALGLRDSTLIDRPDNRGPRDAIGRIVDFFGERRSVLLLDNCEHVIEAAAALTDELLARCPQLRVLTTSREPLGVYGEVLVGVAPLGQPGAEADPVQAMSFAATQLFADRAAAVRPGFVIDDTTVGPVIEIVRRLDGLPLAIELAAARLRSMSVEQIAARLTDRFRLLTSGSRTALPRHRTLRAVVEWSWELLSADERRLARRLAVFVGGITVASAADVCANSGLPHDAVDDLLASLVDKSLLQLVADQGRYRMLETLREFGLERMAEAGELAQVRTAHARHFAALAAHADPMLRTRDQLIWLKVLNAERDNIVAGLRFLADDGEAEAAVNIAMSMNWYWVLMGRHVEAATWTRFALEAAGELTPVSRLIGQAMLSMNSAASMWTGDAEAMQASLDAMIAADAGLDVLARSNQLHPMVAVLRPVLAMFSGNDQRAERLIAEAMTSTDTWLIAAARTMRAVLAENRGDDVEQGRSDASISLAAFREMGERWGMGNCLQLLAPMNTLAGNLVQAAAEYREALELFGSLGAMEDEAFIRMRLADVLMRQGDIAAAQREIETAARQHALKRRGDSDLGPDRESLFGAVLMADIERLAGRVDRARTLRDDALLRMQAMPEPHPAQAHLSTMIYTIAAKIDVVDGDLGRADANLRLAYRYAVGTRDMPLVANVGVGLAMLAAALGRPVESATILGAAAQVRGADDPTALDIVGLNAGLAQHPDATTLVAAHTAGQMLDRVEAIARLDPAWLER